MDYALFYDPDEMRPTVADREIVERMAEFRRQRVERMKRLDEQGRRNPE